MLVRITFFWNVTPCSLIAGYRRFRGACSLYLQVDVAGFSGTSVPIDEASLLDAVTSVKCIVCQSNYQSV
jgi:hypothetical protein